MKTQSPSSHSARSRDAAKRTPITLSADEDRDLLHLALKDGRSKSAMARIIYRLGLRHYVSSGGAENAV